jgi:thiamine monophosphate synthase
VPVVAIGGITVDNLDDVLQTGCAGIAVISAILADANPQLAAARLREAMDSSPHRPKLELRRNANAAHRQPTAV